MKKKLALVLSMILVLSLFAGCSSNIPKEDEKKTEDKQEVNKDEAEKEENQEEEPAASGALKTGLAAITGLGDSKDADKENGEAAVNSLVAAVTVDEKGVITRCVIDGVQTKVSFTKEGKLATDSAEVFPTKNELGEKYGMKSASGIGKEWNEQAKAFADYVVGKTAEEVKGIAVKEGKAADEDLLASVTIHIGDFINVVDKAVTNAADLGAKADDKLGLAITTSIGSSVAASKDAEGLAQVDSSYTVTTVDGSGKITSCYMDGSQAKVTFDTAGKITADITAEVPTKNELGEKYGMKSASGIGKEWNEQAKAFADYVVGKTKDEVNGIAVAEGKAGDEDLLASVTIHISGFIADVVKSAEAAQ